VKEDGEVHSMENQFKQRLLVSSCSILFLLVSIFYSTNPIFKPIFILINAILICIALVEYYNLAENKGFKPLRLIGIASTLAYLFVLSFSFYHFNLSFLPPLILFTSLLLFFLISFKHNINVLGNLAVTVFGIIYLTIPLSYGMGINYFFPSIGLGDGRLWLAYVLLVSKMTDVGAYFSGKLLGKTKLAPYISPQKTVEGALGGVVLALFTSIFFVMQLQPYFKMTFLQSIWIGFLVSILAQLGDLAESLLKRDAGVKDSNRLPGLGGVLDIVDALVFTLPFMYLLLQMNVVG
jgi:phosphatidate cytidylyltransferase